MNKFLVAILVSLFLYGTAYGTCGTVGFQTYNSFDNGFVNYGHQVQFAQPAVILPVLASHNNFVLAGQPVVIDQTIANIGYNNGFVYNSSSNYFVPLNSKKIVVDVDTIQNMKQADAANATAIIDAQNKGVFRGGVLQRLSNVAAGGKTQVKVENKNTTIVRQRLLP